MRPEQRLFVVGCAVEGGLALVAILIQFIFGRPFLSNLHWEIPAIIAGFIATLPPLAFFLYALRSSWPGFRGIRMFLDRALRPVFKTWNIWQLALISILAGVGEELFFRGALQGLLEQWVGSWPGLLLASLIFGAFHPMTRTYFAVTFVIGIYLGLLWWQTDNLLAPVVTHAAYDFLALIFFLRQPESDRRTT